VSLSVCLSVCLSVINSSNVVYTGYIYSSGVSPLVVGVCIGLAGATGILGTFLFTRLRQRLGLERTGIIAFSMEASCLSLAVASVWAPGSPFNVDLSPFDHDLSSCSVNTSTSNVTTTDVRCSSGGSWNVDGVNVSIILLLIGIISSRIGKYP